MELVITTSKLNGFLLEYNKQSKKNQSYSSNTKVSFKNLNTRQGKPQSRFLTELSVGARILNNNIEGRSIYSQIIIQLQCEKDVQKCTRIIKLRAVARKILEQSPKSVKINKDFEYGYIRKNL